ncbi:MAG: S41 family peptidase [Chloroflexota bacterium]
MSLPAFLLLTAVVVQLVGPLVSSLEKWCRLLWLLILGLTGWQVWHDSVLPSMISVYLLLAIMFLFFLAGSFRHWRYRAPLRKPYWLRTVAVCLSLPLVVIPVIEATVLPLGFDDYRRESWPVAFEHVHTTLQTHYAFGKWKKIDWHTLYDRHYPKIVEAEQMGDEKAYYVALREYIYALPDGHVGITSQHQNEAEWADIGGGFGFAVLRLNDGRVIAHIVDRYGPAARAGMTWGAEIVDWDGQPVSEAVASVPTLWASRPPATTRNVSIAQHQLLTRASIGTELIVTFRNQGASQTQTVILSAINDGFGTYRKAVHWQMAEPSTEPIRHVILNSNVGYIQISTLEPIPGKLGPVEAMNRAMQHMLDENVQALVIDVRGNRGGLDTMVPAMMSYFTPSRLHYEGVTTYNRWVKDFSRLFSLYVNPNELQFTKPVVVLVDHRTKSSGEGFGLIAKSLSTVSVVGIHGTDGSFGMAGASILLPTDIEVSYPWGQSVDLDGIVQVDSNHALEGGIQPDISIPLTFDIAKEIYLDGNDVVLNFAQDYLQKQLAKQ